MNWNIADRFRIAAIPTPWVDYIVNRFNPSARKVRHLQIEEINKQHKDPVQLPCNIYTHSDRLRYKWTARLVYVDDRYCDGYIRVDGRKKKAAYVVQIVDVVDTIDPTAPLPSYYKQLIGVATTTPTKANQLIKRKSEKCSASGWEAWKLEHTQKELKYQKIQRCKKTGTVKYSGGGFLNPQTRTCDQVRFYCEHNGRAYPPTERLPPLTRLELRKYWFSKASVKGGIKSIS